MRSSNNLLGLTIAAALAAAAGPAAAQPLPAIKSATTNTVEQCATPGRLQAYLNSRNPNLDPRFKTIAIDYMREGEALGIRWDYAFFHMLQETANLSFANGARAAGLKAAQNNFAGIGAADGAAGESFADVKTGVRAHLQHVLLYAGEKLDNPVADRTRKVQEWGVLADWHKAFKRPITFADLAAKWVPKSRAYVDGIEQTASTFLYGLCKKADPNPEYANLARAQKIAATMPVAAAEPSVVAPNPDKNSGAEMARRAVSESNGARSSLGATAGTTVKILNAPDASAQPDAPLVENKPTETAKQPPARPVSSPAVAAAPVAPSAAQKCRVWTASYGGQRAVIVKAMIDNVANFTVLDVNDGQEQREADAFIAAYAKGGAIAGTFPDQNKALEKAFELCPEG